MSELGTERDSYGSNSNGLDSPGAQSGWERAWMRQRHDGRCVQKFLTYFFRSVSATYLFRSLVLPFFEQQLQYGGLRRNLLSPFSCSRRRLLEAKLRHAAKKHLHIYPYRRKRCTWCFIVLAPLCLDATTQCRHMLFVPFQVLLLLYRPRIYVLLF